MAAAVNNSFEKLYELDAIKATYYGSHVIMTLVSPPLLYRLVKLGLLLLFWNLGGGRQAQR